MGYNQMTKEYFINTNLLYVSNNLTNKIISNSNNLNNDYKKIEKQSVELNKMLNNIIPKLNETYETNQKFNLNDTFNFVKNIYNEYQNSINTLNIKNQKKTIANNIYNLNSILTKNYSTKSENETFKNSKNNKNKNTNLYIILILMLLYVLYIHNNSNNN